MGAYSSTEACELPDLSIDVDLADGAKLPVFETTGRGGLALYANQDVTLNANEKTLITTGVTVHLPFMLIGLISGNASMHVDVATEVVDFDTAQPLTVSATFRPTALHREQNVTQVGFKKGDKVAMLAILPIARPGLCVSRPARDDADGI